MPKRMSDIKKLILSYIFAVSAASDGPPWPAVTPLDLHLRSRDRTENAHRGYLRDLCKSGVLERSGPDHYRLPDHADPGALREQLFSGKVKK